MPPLAMSCATIPLLLSAVASCWSVPCALAPRTSTFVLHVLHAPFAQLCPFGHALPHAPQFDASFRRFLSQPFFGSLSQSPKFALHPARPHTPFAQSPIPSWGAH